MVDDNKEEDFDLDVALDTAGDILDLPKFEELPELTYEASVTPVEEVVPEDESDNPDLETNNHESVPMASAISVLDEGLEKAQKPYDYHESFKINVTWYSGKMDDKTYEVSPENMPEFLDPHKKIKAIHINVDSAYGWNVFFDNGVFMNLVDLKKYQERHGKIPSSGGKIIYANKTTTFERIERIVVYVKPRYVQYSVK